MSDPTPRPLPHRVFASDNYAGICPEAWEAMARANHGHTPSYGDDPWCERAADLLREIFETPCEVFFTFNGTAANSLALAHLCHPYHGILCHEYAHIETDECGAPEFFSNGAKLLTVPGPHGKLDLARVEAAIRRRSDIHYPKPCVLSITQVTELGTVYTVEELRSIHEIALRHNLRVHMDGARFANAVAALGCAPKEISWKVGVDVLCFGSTKNGTHAGEAVIFFDRKLAEEFDYRCKQAGQLASKMRFLAAPLVGLLESGAWLRNARHANEAAAKLEAGLRKIPGISILFPREANSVFVDMPQACAEAMHARGWLFYDFIGSGGHRLMCSWDTADQDIEDFLRDLRECIQTTR